MQQILLLHIFHWGQPSLLPKNNKALFLGIKCTRPEINPSPPPTVKVINKWSYASLPPYVFTA
jgi:hypothetical protein